MNIKININQITQLNIFPKEEHHIKWWDAIIYKWYEKLIWFFLLKNKPAGYYNHWGTEIHYYENERELLTKVKNIYIEDKIVYYKPYIIIKLSSGVCINQRFENKKDLETFIIENNFDKKPWITINHQNENF